MLPLRRLPGRARGRCRPRASTGGAPRRRLRGRRALGRGVAPARAGAGADGSGGARGAAIRKPATAARAPRPRRERFETGGPRAEEVRAVARGRWRATGLPGSIGGRLDAPAVDTCRSTIASDARDRAVSRPREPRSPPAAGRGRSEHGPGLAVELQAQLAVRQVAARGGGRRPRSSTRASASRLNRQVERARPWRRRRARGTTRPAWGGGSRAGLQGRESSSRRPPRGRARRPSSPR